MRDAVTTQERDRIKAREREIRELRQANEIQKGGQYRPIRDTERLAEAAIKPSVGSVGDPSDNARAETINGLYKPN